MQKIPQHRLVEETPWVGTWLNDDNPSNPDTDPDCCDQSCPKYDWVQIAVQYQTLILFLRQLIVCPQQNPWHQISLKTDNRNLFQNPSPKSPHDDKTLWLPWLGYGNS